MPIATSSIRPGDLLLFHGKSFVSWAIRKIDGSEVNHVAIALEGGRLAEAGGLGLTSRPIPTSFTDDDYMLVRSHLAQEPKDPVIATAENYLANRNFYAYQQIVLLAVLGLTRRIPARGLARRMIRSALDHASAALMELLPVGKSWMICSEYAYRCFDEAVESVPDPFRIDISGVTYAAPVSGEDSWLDWAFANVEGVDLHVPTTFAAPAVRDLEAAAESDLAPLIAEWGQFAGITEADPLPVGPASLTFAPAVDTKDPGVRAEAEAREIDEVPDADLQDSMVRFSQTLMAARGTAPGIPMQFGVVPGAVAAAAAKGALAGLMSISVEPNFVTPRDLLVSSSFTAPQRAQ